MEHWETIDLVGGLTMGDAEIPYGMNGHRTRALREFRETGTMTDAWFGTEESLARAERDGTDTATLGPADADGIDWTGFPDEPATVPLSEAEYACESEKAAKAVPAMEAWERDVRARVDAQRRKG